MAKVIGTVKSIHGKAAVKKVNDQLETLKVGDALHENEMVYALGGESTVTLDLEGGRTLQLNGYDEVLLDSSVFTALEKGESLDVDALRQAIADGLDETNAGETAAGDEVIGEANAGADFAVRNDARGDVSSYLTGTESSPFGVTGGEDTGGIFNTAPLAVDNEGVAVEEGKGPQNRYGKGGEGHGGHGEGEGEHGGHGNRYQYDAPVVATGNVLDNDTDDGLPSPADLDVIGVSSINTANSATFANGYFTIVGQYGTLVINAETGAYTYTVDDKNHDVDAMNKGDSLIESFNYTVSDGALTDVGTLRITILGSNDAPIAVPDHNFVKEAGDSYDHHHRGEDYHEQSVAKGNVLENDHDVDNENLSVSKVQSGEITQHGEHGGQEGQSSSIDTHGYDYAVQGEYGILYMNRDGSYKYVLDNDSRAVDSLNANDHVQETFTYTLTDGDKTDRATLTIDIEGTNDRAIITGDNCGGVIEDVNVYHGRLYDSGRLYVSDVDEGEAKFNTHVTADSHNIGGTLTIDQYGHWTYSIDNSLIQHLPEGVKVYEYFTVKSFDGTDSETIKITITGTNDRAIITGDDIGGVTEDAGVNHGKLYDSGHLYVSDVDDGEAKFNTHVTADPHNIGGTLTIDQYGHWNYSISNALVQYLGAGDKVYEYFTVKSLDGTDSETIKITITGTNDRAFITGDDQGGVTEDVSVYHGRLYDSGRLYVSDADQGEARFNTNVIADSNNLGGHLTIDQYGHWIYSIDNSLVQYLGAGEKLYEYFTVKSLDGTDSETIKITITGTNDAPIANADYGDTDIVTHTTTVTYDLNAGNDYANSGVTITPINGSSVDRSGPTMGVDGPLGNDSTQMIDPLQSHLEKVGKHNWQTVVDAEAEGIRFDFSQNISHAVVDFGNFGDHDTAGWAIYNTVGTLIDSGTYTNDGNPNDSILIIDSDTAFSRLEIMNIDNSDSFSIDRVLASGGSTSSITTGSLLYFSESELLANDTDVDHGDVLNVIGVDNTSAYGAVITIDDDGNILYNPNDALHNITEPTVDTFNYQISDGHGGTSTAEVSVTLVPTTTTDAYTGQTLLIEGDHSIDFSNLSNITDLASTNNISQIDLKNGATELTNVTPESVDSLNDSGTLYINGSGNDSVTLSGDWTVQSGPAGYDTFESNGIVLHIDTDVNVIP